MGIRCIIPLTSKISGGGSDDVSKYLEAKMDEYDIGQDVIDHICQKMLLEENQTMEEYSWLSPKGRFLQTLFMVRQRPSS